MSARRCYSFGEFRLDLRRGTLYRATTEVRLRPKSFAVLRFLAERHGQLVSKDELLEGVWGRTVVTEGSITQCLLDVRRAIGDESQRIIRTVPRRGYIFDAAVVESDCFGADALDVNGGAAASAGTARPRGLGSRRNVAFAAVFATGMLLLVLAYVITRPPDRGPQASRPTTGFSIAVLPFVDMSPGKDQQYLADGFAEEILDRLAGARTLQVIARTSSFALRDQAMDVPEIAAKLGVTHVLEGSVRRSGEQVRVTVQLVDAASNTRLWSRTFDRTLGDLLPIQDEIAGAVASSLRITLADVGTAGSPPANAEAHELFLMGRFFFNRRNPGDVERAWQHFENAVASDPGFALGWSSVSAACRVLAWDGDRTAYWRARQGESARRAVDLDPNLLEARLRLASYYFETGKLDAALEQYRAAATLDPTNRWLARVAAGYPDWKNETMESIVADARTVVGTDPVSSVAHFNLGVALFGADQFDEALSEFSEALELSPQQATDVRLEIGRVLVALGRYDEAYAAIMRLPVDLRDYGLALLHNAPGRRGDADAALARIEGRPGDYMHAIRVAKIDARLGRHDDAFDWLQRARDGLQQDEALLSRIWYLQNEMYLSPFLKPLHSDPRWSALMQVPDSQ